jgi:gamma-glutamyl-gamma-aminobutyrate hydrolase PuuD
MKKIGIVGWSTGENSFGITKPYFNFFEHFGRIIILGPNDEALDDLDLVVMPGGLDISSSVYNQVPKIYNTNPDLFKEYFFSTTLQKYIDKGTPIFGICLGMQQLCVHFGAEMIQQLSDHPYSIKERDELVHELSFEQPFGWLRRKLYGTKKVKTNSLHRQGVDPDTFPEELQIVARASDGGLNPIEVIKHRELPIWGVQYHPEEIFDTLSVAVVSHLLDIEKL